MKKSSLPKNWLVCSSKSYPDKVYYFNTVTNKASWIMPATEDENQASPKKRNPKKRKKGSDAEASRPTTPEITQEIERPVLQAKRRISLIQSKGTNETPQMREIREKMLEKQAKLSKALKPGTSTEKDTPIDQLKIKGEVPKVSDSKISDVNLLDSKVSNNKKDTKLPESKVTSPVKAKGRFSEPARPSPRRPGRRPSTAGSESSAKEEAPLAIPASSTGQNMTPQMRLLYEKIEQKKALKTGSPRKSLASSSQSSSSSSTTSSSSSGSTSRSYSSSRSNSTSSFATSSQTSSKLTESKEPLVPSQPAQKIVTTRRRSRLSTVSSPASASTNLSNLSALQEEKEPEEKKQEERRPSTTSTRRTRRTIFIQDKEIEKAEPDTTFNVRSPHSRINYPKNVAKRRLDDLRRSLSLEREAKVLEVAEKRMSLGVRETQIPNVSSNRLVKDFSEPGPEPNFYTNSTQRAKALRDRVLTYQNCSVKINKAVRQKDVEPEEMENQPILTRLKDFNNDPYYEEMEWEPIEDEKIMSEVQAVRTQLCDTRSMNAMNVIQENILELPPEPVRNKEQTLYIVIDTNVFLSNLQAVEEARDSVFKSFGRPFIVIPWTVIQELDFIKDDKSATRSETLKAKARRAVRFLHQHFSARHPRVLGQRPEDVARNKELFAIDCPDDEILQSCLQIREAGRSVVLLSYDKNLCNKAMIHDIATLGRDDPFEKIDYLNINDSRNDSFSANHLSFKGENPDSLKAALDEELLAAEDIFEEAKAVLQSLLSPVVATEMQNLYGDVWERYTIVRPPWSTKDVLKCAVKHWMAAVSESFTRRAESILKELLEAIAYPPNGGRKLKDVSCILERCIDLMQTLKQQKYPNLLDEKASAIATLKQRCFEETGRISEKRIRDEIGHDENIARQDCRAEVALNYFNKVYAFTRDFCGVAAESINMPCPFLFEKNDKRLTTNFVNNYQPVVAANLNHLLQILSLALEDINGLRPNHRAIIVLAEALTTFFPDEFNDPNNEVTSLDLYYCIKNKADVMKRGLTQLQDLSQQFCRMASFRCR